MEFVSEIPADKKTTIEFSDNEWEEGRIINGELFLLRFVAGVEVSRRKVRSIRF